MMSTYTRNITRMRLAVRCGARTRSGSPCKSPAVAGSARCRMHGSAPNCGAALDNTNALKHGFYRRTAIAERRKERDVLRRARKLLDEFT